MKQPLPGGGKGYWAEGISKSEQGEGLSSLPGPHPVVSVFPSDHPPLTQMDLISTIGESAALGAAGVILWGDAGYTTSTVSKCPHPAYQSGVCRGQAKVGALSC